MSVSKPETVGVIYRLPTSELHPHPDNPFPIRDDPEMKELSESVQKFGVLVPAIARASPDGGYELISGHRRKYACEKNGIDFITGAGFPGTHVKFYRIRTFLAV